MTGQKSMTALISAFSRAYHAQKSEVKIFDDMVAGRLLTNAELFQIAESMANGIGFFNPAFQGNREAALRWVVDNQLSPSPLGRAAFAEKSLAAAVSIGARQYLILGAGYDTFAYRQPDWAQKLQIFEMDHPATAQDKKQRLAAASICIPENVHFITADFTDIQWHGALMQSPAFSQKKISFCSLLGVTYYLPKPTFEALVASLFSLLPEGSSLVFDYPDENSYTDSAGERSKKQALLAAGAKESMLTSYSYAELEQLLSRHGFLIYEHLSPAEITAQYFAAYNAAQPSHPMAAFDNVNYCLAVKK